MSYTLDTVSHSYRLGNLGIYTKQRKKANRAVNRFQQPEIYNKSDGQVEPGPGAFMRDVNIIRNDAGLGVFDRQSSPSSPLTVCTTTTIYYIPIYARTISE